LALAFGEIFEELLRDGRFGLAVESLCYCIYCAMRAMMAAGLWAGIEAFAVLLYEVTVPNCFYCICILNQSERRKFAVCG